MPIHSPGSHGKANVVTSHCSLFTHYAGGTNSPLFRRW